MTSKKLQPFREHWSLLALLLLGLALRLAAWRWHEQVPLGGDEQEYFSQALTLLRDHRYVELKLMRPPGYTAFLAIAMYLFDSLVQNLRLLQAIISTATILPVYALTKELFAKRRIALLAAALVALNYSLAATATELLTETVFVFGLSMLLWLLTLSARKSSLRWPVLAGLTLGALILTRSVALPLLAVGMLWLWAAHRPVVSRQQPVVSNLAEKQIGHQKTASRHPLTSSLNRLVSAKMLAFLIATLLVLLPWTARNFLSYGTLILVDTTGAENLWLDNDPAGREAVKAQLYALGDDRGLRQSLASQRGMAAILNNPAHFLTKAWGEAKRFMALEHTDDMLARPAIWIAPTEVWLRLVLGDGLWLLIAFMGVLGLWLCRLPAQHLRYTALLLGLWCLYIMFTSLIFHVELRYRLPLYPVLIPYAAAMLGIRSQRTALTIPLTFGKPISREAAKPRTILFRSRKYILHTQSPSHPVTQSPSHPVTQSPSAPISSPQPPDHRWRLLAATLSCLLMIGLMLLHRNYTAEALCLAPKHLALAQAEYAFTQGLIGIPISQARSAAQRALDLDPQSVLARVSIARAALSIGDSRSARASLDEAIAILPAHSYAHLLRGAMLRANGENESARRDLAYESASREDLQSWTWERLTPVNVAPQQLAIGDGLDLGYIRGFYLPEDGYRWTRATASIKLSSEAAAHVLLLELASGRPASLPNPQLQVLVNGMPVTTLDVGPTWQQYQLTLPAPVRGTSLIELRSPTFQPRILDKKSGDARQLGVMLRKATLTP